MLTRRHALKMLAGASAIGSLSGCVQVATQGTTHFSGTPAMLSETRGGLAGTASSEGYLAMGVGVEAHKTVERFGVSKEIVAHSWGMVYRNGTTAVENLAHSGMDLPGGSQGGAVATFTTPSIKIAGQELNPIKDVTVGEIGTELLGTVRNGTAWPGRDAQMFSTSAVQKATGKKVLRAFRDAVGSQSGSEVETSQGDIGVFLNATNATNTPDWDGGENQTVTLDWATNPGGAGNYTAETNQKDQRWQSTIRFEKHGGDFVVLLSAIPTQTDGTDAQLSSSFVAPIAANRTMLGKGSTGESGPRGVIHPPDDDFSQEMLKGHLIDTTLNGTRALVKQSRTLIDETQEQLEKASNDTRDEENETLSIIRDTQNGLKQIDSLLAGVEENLSSLSADTIIGGTGMDTFRRVREQSRKAAEIAAGTDERIASYNDTREEENESLITIGRNLGGLKEATETLTVTYDKLIRSQ